MPANGEQSLLLALPAEVRKRIYEFIFQVLVVFVKSKEGDAEDPKMGGLINIHSDSKPDVALFRTCRLIYAEAYPVYLSRELIISWETPFVGSKPCFSPSFYHFKMITLCPHSKRFSFPWRKFTRLQDVTLCLVARHKARDGSDNWGGAGQDLKSLDDEDVLVRIAEWETKEYPWFQEMLEERDNDLQLTIEYVIVGFDQCICAGKKRRLCDARHGHSLVCDIVPSFEQILELIPAP